jgi:putative proteasome-type protease
MTYCLGIKLKAGLVAIADTRITSGTETTTAKKISLFEDDHQSMFIMTSGLRSVRDKAVTYFKEIMDEEKGHFNKLYKAVNSLGAQLRKVSKEDREALEDAGLTFNLYSIIGGQLRDDDEPHLYLLYPEGNWVEIGYNTPFVIIGNSGYGKPILNRTISYDTSIETALKAGILSFDSTRVSANDVDFPIDVVLYKPNTYQLISHRYTQTDLSSVSESWDKSLHEALNQVPEHWMSNFLNEFKHQVANPNAL